MTARSVLRLLALVSIAGCGALPDEGARTSVSGVDEATYVRAVHPVLVKHCGAADCHGRAERGLRVFGKGAVRAAGVAAAAPTTEGEARETLVSVLGLEPERTRGFLARTDATIDDARALTFLSKAIERERHRGGLSLRRGEAAEQCLTSWLLHRTDELACHEGSLF